jgi:uncharacterized membrane protein
MPLSLFIVAASVAWASAIVVTVVAASSSLELFSGMTPLVHRLAALICHQRPERSFATSGVPWPVCARCAGLYAGACLGSLLSLTLPRPASWDRFVQSTRRFLPIAATPTVVTLLAEWMSGVMPGNLIRAVSAIPLGAALVIVLVVAAAWPARAVGVH